MQIWDVAFKLRQEIMYASSIKLPENLKVEDIFKGEVEVPDLVQNFFKYLTGVQFWPGEWRISPTQEEKFLAIRRPIKFFRWA